MTKNNKSFTILPNGQMLEMINGSMRSQPMKKKGGGIPAQSNVLSFPTARVLTHLGESYGQKPKKRKKKNKNRTQVGYGSGLSIPGTGVAYKPRFTFKFIVPMTTATTTGNFLTNFWLGNANTVSSNSMSSISTTQYTNIVKPFYWQTIHKLNVEFIPLAAYTVGGTAGSAYWPDPTSPSTTLTTNQAIIEKPFGVVSDVKECHMWNWLPSNEQDREAKEISDASAVTGAPLRDYAPGLICLTVLTNATGGATLVGNFVITVDMTLSGLV